MALDFDKLFATYRFSAWRLEVRDVYKIPGDDKRIAEFMRTGRAPRKTRENNGWIRTVEDACARGAYIGRIRLVGHPLTDYTRFELSAYADNVAAGEDIRLIDRMRLDPSWDAAPDVWVFDDKQAIKMFYSDDGAWLGFQECEAAPYVNVRCVLTPLAVPLADYQPTKIPTSRDEAFNVRLSEVIA